MLRYTEVELSPYEIPGESSLNIYISGCLNHCPDCHYPELQCPDFGEELTRYIANIVSLYERFATCITFMGEGSCTDAEKAELCGYAKKIHERGMKAALYCGRDTEIESWMENFDYVKIGSYQAEKGTLTQKSTNQRLYKQSQGEWTDITSVFW